MASRNKCVRTNTKHLSCTFQRVVLHLRLIDNKTILVLGGLMQSGSKEDKQSREGGKRMLESVGNLS